jgi:DNA replicative helicase MCM subunit Mcm2 (Cdc46/Mcm family)
MPDKLVTSELKIFSPTVTTDNDIRNTDSSSSWHEPISIKEALFNRLNTTITVKGQIISAGKIHSMSLASNPLAEARAIHVELMDVESYDDIDGLKIILTNELAKDVRIGENCKITGILKTEPSGSSKNISYLILHANRLEYTVKNQDAQDDSLTQAQIDRVHKFIKLATEQYDDDNTIIDRLVSIYNRRVIKNYNIKEALIYALASTTAHLPDGSDINDTRNRLNVGLIGFPGGGKTYTAKSVMKYSPRIRFESAQSSSGISLTAMISREGEGGRVLRVGSVAKAKQSLCVIDEIAELPIQEQSLLQGVMEEGMFTINKYGFNANIRADTVIVWTSNPKNATNATTRLSYQDLRIRKQILDRTDLLIVQKPLIEPKDREEFNLLKLELERASPERKKIISNYDDYLKLHFAVMKRKYSDHDVKLSKEASELMAKADTEIQSKKAEGAGSFRTLDTLTRLTKVIAKLKLKDIADVSDATRAISFFNEISTVNIIETNNKDNDLIRDPAAVAKDVMIEILRANPNTEFTITELAEKAIEINETAKAYIQEATDLRTNKRLRRVAELLAKSTEHVQRVSQTPAKYMAKTTPIA